MNGPMSAYKEKQQIADSFIERLKPYEKLTPLRFDLRGYAKFFKRKWNSSMGTDVSFARRLPSVLFLCYSL